MLGAEHGAEDGLAGEVEVAGVLEHGPGGELAHGLAGQAGALGEAVERGGEHVLVGRGGVGAVGAGEGDAVAGDDGDAADGLHT